MPNGALIAIGITLFLCAFAFATPIIDPSSIPFNTRPNLSFIYISTTLSIVLGIACFVPVILRVKKDRYNRKHKIYKKKPTMSRTAPTQANSGDWYSNLQNFDLGRLTFAGWILSLFSVIGGVMTCTLFMGDNVSQASNAGRKFMAIIIFGVISAFFGIGKWILDRFNIRILKY